MKELKIKMSFLFFKHVVYRSHSEACSLIHTTLFYFVFIVLYFGIKKERLEKKLLFHWQRTSLKLRSFKSSEHINEKGDGPYRDFGYISLDSDPIDLATWSQREPIQRLE